MTKTLCLDFGNTRLKCALFLNDVLQEIILLQNGEPEEIENIIVKHRPEKSILSSVVHHNAAIEEILKSNTVFHKLSYDTKLPITSPVGKPSTIGADRLALCVAATHFFPGKNNLVIGLGSAITYNFINQYNEFLGGGIAPGMQMRFKSLQMFTALLPLVEKDWNFPLIGYDTKTNILSGVVLGMANEINGFIDLYKERYDNFNVVLTGGDALHFVPHIKNKIFADSEFLFKGLYAISEYNNP